ncbi:MAG: Calvin cycle protein CP12 [Dolichospermum sp.]|jgi:D-mannonate dehydratase|nr:Calvin cycle protein CP12 [Anabaena sp. 49628_E55]
MTFLNEVINGKKPIEEAIFEAIVKARTTCEENGNSSTNCVLAWNVVEKLEVEKAYQKQVKHRKTSLEEYCEMYPDALECLIYDI